jgi:hypothetical protein
MFAAGQLEAAEASVASEGSWIDEALLPCLCCVYDATVELDDGRDISWPIDGSLSSKLLAVVGGVLKAGGRSKTCRIEGRRKESSTWGRGRMDVEAVVY